MYMIYYFAHEGANHANEAEAAAHQKDNNGVLIFIISIVATLLLAAAVRYLNKKNSKRG